MIHSPVIQSWFLFRDFNHAQSALSSHRYFIFIPRLSLSSIESPLLLLPHPHHHPIIQYSPMSACFANSRNTWEGHWSDTTHRAERHTHNAWESRSPLCAPGCYGRKGKAYMGVIEPPVRIDKMRSSSTEVYMYTTTSLRLEAVQWQRKYRDQLFLHELSREIKARMTNACRRNKV